MDDVRPSKRQKISLESYVANDIIELLDSDEKYKLAPKRTADDDFLDLLTNVSYHKIVEGEDDKLSIKTATKGPTFEPDLTQSLREMDELQQLLHLVSTAPPSSGQPSNTPAKYLELRSVQREEVSEIQDLQVILHDRRRRLRDASLTLKAAALELKKNTENQAKYQQHVLQLQHKEGVLQLPSKGGLIDTQVPFTAKTQSVRQQRLWESLFRCVQRLPASAGLSLTWLMEDTIRLELTTAAHVICKRRISMQQQWQFTELDFETNIPKMTGKFIHALMLNAVLRTEAVADQETAERALTMKHPAASSSKYNPELEKVFLHLQHIAYILELHSGLSQLKQSSGQQAKVALQFQLSRPMQWPNISTYTLVIGKSRIPVSIVGTVCHVKLMVRPQPQMVVLPGLELLDWILVRVNEESHAL